jgi:hypothetical protein
MEPFLSSSIPSSVYSLPTDPVMGGSLSGAVGLRMTDAPPGQGLGPGPGPGQGLGPGQGQAPPPLAPGLAPIDVKRVSRSEGMQELHQARRDHLHDPLDSSTMHPALHAQVVESLHKARLAGATALPSRDISMSTSQWGTDPSVAPNYVPPPHTRHYVPPSSGEKVERVPATAWEQWWDWLQLPLFLCLLYGVFQLPGWKHTVYQWLPWTCRADGQWNVWGLAFMSSLFALVACAGPFVFVRAGQWAL